MNNNELRHLKMEWIAAKEANDTERQIRLLRDHPEAQAALSEFIAACAATTVFDINITEPLLPLAQRASQTALKRVFEQQAVPTAIVAANLAELRNKRGFSMVDAAQGLRLSVDVWKKFESGVIELKSLSERQLDRLASFFQVTAEQFGTMLNNSQPSFTLNRRQTGQAARNMQPDIKMQSFAEAIKKSTMTPEEKRFWSDEAY